MKLLNDLISAVKVRQNEITEALAAGQAEDFEAYQRLVGRFQGLKESIEILNNLMEEKNE
jgi:hypothetical protein